MFFKAIKNSFLFLISLLREMFISHKTTLVEGKDKTDMILEEAEVIEPQEMTKEEKIKNRKLTNTFLVRSREQQMEARFVPNHSKVWFFIDKWSGYYERDISLVRLKEVKDKKGKVSTLVYLSEENGTEHCLDGTTLVVVRGYQLEQERTTWFYSEEREDGN
jgi:hypothetical protein